MPITAADLPSLAPALALVMALALHLMLALSGFGAMSVALPCQHSGQKTKKVFLEKFALQMATLGSLLLIYLLLAASGLSALAMYHFPDLSRPWLINPSLWMPVVGAMVWGIGFGFCYRIFWKPMKKRQGPHKLLGLYAILGGIAVAAVAVQIKSFIYLQPERIQAPLSDIFTWVPPAFSWIILAQTLALAPAAASAMGLIWLLVRRGKDDFGRDYYGFAAPLCAKWAAFWTLAFVLASASFAGIMHQTLAASPNWRAVLAADGTGLGLGLMAAVSWLPVIRSATPMRHKPFMILGLVLLWMSVGAVLAAQALVVTELLP